MPTPKKPVPRAIVDSASIDDGWALPGEFDLQSPAASEAPTEEPSEQRVEAKSTPQRYQRIEDWFDEVDLGWCLPDEDGLAELPPSPLAIEAGPPVEIFDTDESLELYEVEVIEVAEPIEVIEVAKPVEVIEVAEPVEVIEVAEPVEVIEVAEPIEVIEVAKPVERDSGKLDLNSATSDELLALPGVGPKKANAILAWREKHGRFNEVEDLTRVNGFGAKSVAKLAAHVTVRNAS